MSVHLPILYALEAQLDLNEIAVWNEERYGSEHAARYIDYLQSQIEERCQDSKKNHAVPALPGLQYVLVRRKSAAHGHIAIFRRDEHAINVVHVFHSAQDWQQRLVDESSPK